MNRPLWTPEELAETLGAPTVTMAATLGAASSEARVARRAMSPLAKRH